MGGSSAGASRDSTRPSQFRAVPVATSVDAGWTFAPIVLLALAGYVVVYVLRWRTARREGGARAAGAWRLVAWCAGVARAVRGPHLARGPARGAARVDAHGPAPAGRRPRADPAHPRPHALDPAARDAPDPPHRARGRAARASRRGRRRLRRRHVALARARRCTTRRSSTRRCTCSSTSASPPPGSSTGGSCSRPSPRACASRGWAPWPTCSRPRSSSACSASRSPSRPSSSTTPTGPAARRWGLSPLDDQHVAGLIMALEQSIVMGIALAWLFARMLAESERANEREERVRGRRGGAAPGRRGGRPHAPRRIARAAQPSSTAPSSISAGPSTVTDPRTATSRPNVTSPAHRQPLRRAQRRRAVREARVEVAQELEVVVVQVDERRRRAARGEHDAGAVAQLVGVRAQHEQVAWSS